MMGVVVAVVMALCCFADFQQVQAKSAKGNWLCRKHSHCNGGCCKGFICVKYLKEGELCLIEHKWNVGCGCAAPMKCKQDWMLWRCVHEKEEENGKEGGQEKQPEQQQQHRQPKQMLEKNEAERGVEKKEALSLGLTADLDNKADILMEEEEKGLREGMADKIVMGREYDRLDNHENDFFTDEGVDAKGNGEDKDLHVEKDEKENQGSRIKDLEERVSHDEYGLKEKFEGGMNFKDNDGLNKIEELKGKEEFNENRDMNDIGGLDAQSDMEERNWWYTTGGKREYKDRMTKDHSSD